MFRPLKLLENTFKKFDEIEACYDLFAINRFLQVQGSGLIVIDGRGLSFAHVSLHFHFVLFAETKYVLFFIFT